MKMLVKKDKYTIRVDGKSLLSMNDLCCKLGVSRDKLRGIAKIVGQHYAPFDIKISGKEKVRHIDNPSEELKRIQRRIAKRILSTFPVPDGMCGGVVGKSTKDNAIKHVGKPMLVTLDLKNCYPSINNKEIHKIFMECFGCGRDTAYLLTVLTTYQHRLPQGAPSSSLLANIALTPVYEKIGDLIKDTDIDLTFFVDDITLSGNGAEKIMEQIIRIIQKYGYAISCRKKFLQPANTCQKVTGIVVNKNMNIDREYYEQTRLEIIELAASQEILQTSLDTIKGKLRHIRSFNPAREKSLQKLYDKLLPVAGKNGTKPKGYKIIPCRCARKHMYENPVRST